MARSDTVRQYPFMAWDRLKPRIVWRQGQHVFCCGGTGSGKSTVAGEFLPRRSQVVVCVSKGFDEIFAGPYYRDYTVIRKWPPPRTSPGKPPLDRVLLWPQNGKTLRETAKIKQGIFQTMFDDILLRRGHWCIDVDEEHYMVDTLGLAREITDILEQGRSAHISLWNNTQRPASIPLATYVNSSHAFLFSSQEEYDVKRLGSMVNKHTHPRELMENLRRLDSFNTHELIYIDRAGNVPPVRSIVTTKRR